MNKVTRWFAVPVLTALFWSTARGGEPSAIEAVTFAVESSSIYVPLEEAGLVLAWKVKRDEKTKRIQLNQETVPSQALRKLPDGQELIRLTALEQAGAQVEQDAEGKITVGAARRSFTVTIAPKRAEVNLAQQRLRAWQGERKVLESRVSSGRRGRTPAGNFRAGPYKARRHYSSRYNNAAMPWSVQVTGHIFIHGFTSVPKYPASHGCIRLPLNEGNPARFFYEWIDKGTPIRVVRK